MSLFPVPKVQLKLAIYEWKALYGTCCLHREEFFKIRPPFGDYRRERPEYLALAEFAGELDKQLLKWVSRDISKEYKVTIPLSILVTLHRDRAFFKNPPTLLAKIDHLLVNLLPPF